MQTQVRTYSISLVVGLIISTAILVACDHRIEQTQSKLETVNPIADGQLSQEQDSQALSVIEAASALHNRPETKTEDIQALQVEPQVLKEYAGRYDSAR